MYGPDTLANNWYLRNTDPSRHRTNSDIGVTNNFQRSINLGIAVLQGLEAEEPSTGALLGGAVRGTDSLFW